MTAAKALRPIVDMSFMKAENMKIPTKSKNNYKHFIVMVFSIEFSPIAIEANGWYVKNSFEWDFSRDLTTQILMNATMLNKTL